MGGKEEGRRRADVQTERGTRGRLKERGTREAAGERVGESGTMFFF